LALKKVYFGSLGPFVYDDTVPVNDPDGDFAGEDHKAMTTDGQLRVEQGPVADEEVLRLVDLGFRLMPPVSVVDIDNPTELNVLTGDLGALVLAYQIIGATVQNEYTIYAYDASGPAVNAPYIVDASGVGDERWIAIGGKYTAQLFYASGGIRVGGALNYLSIDNSGVISLHGTAERKLTLRPEIDYTAQLAHAKPTQVTIGIFKGFSFPIYAADNEELFFRQRVPGRWNGTSDIMFYAGVCLSAAEDVGDYFKFRFSWEHTIVGEEVPITSNNVDIEQAVLVGRNAQYDLYRLDFTIDYDIDGVGNEIKAGELIAGRLYRIDATDPDVSNEIILLNWATEYTVDKMFKTL